MHIQRLWTNLDLPRQATKSGLVAMEKMDGARWIPVYPPQAVRQGANLQCERSLDTCFAHRFQGIFFPPAVSLSLSLFRMRGDGGTRRDPSTIDWRWMAYPTSALP